jgi:hypothetical protein
MPRIGFARPPVAFSSLADAGVSTSDDPLVELPRGFDAVAQFDQRLLQAHLAQSLARAGLSTLRTKFPIDAVGLPGEVRAAAALFLGPLASAGPDEHSFELRLSDAYLLTLGTNRLEELGTVFLSAPFPSRGESAQIGWAIELNLLRSRREAVLDLGTTDPSFPPPSTSDPFHFSLDAISATGRGDDRQPRDSETRTALASGRLVMNVPALLEARAELLQAWLAFNTANASMVLLAAEPPLVSLLTTQLGQDLLRACAYPLTSKPEFPASPVVALAGNLASQHIVGMGLDPMRAQWTVHARPQHGEVLSLIFNFGSDASGALSQLRPFIGRRNFAFSLAREMLTPILKARWRLGPSAHEIVGNVSLEMPLHAGAEETGEGEARIRIRLGAELKAADLSPAFSAHGDLLHLACDQEIELLAAWYANGDAVDDLGALGEPATMPVVLVVSPFGELRPEDAMSGPMREFLFTLLEPLAMPLVQRFRIHSLDGFLSRALGASAAWWSLPTRTQEETAGGGLLTQARQ